MKINRVKFRGFGRWIDQEFTFVDGINLIEAPNEAGKSTLLQGMFALLYGAKKEGLKTKRAADWYGKFLPWQGEDYGGEIEYTLGPDSYRLVRNLRIDKDAEELINLTKSIDITSQFPMDKKRKDRCFLEKQTGLSGESFRRIAMLTSGSLILKDDSPDGDSRMVEKLKLLMSQGEDLDATPAVKKLEAQLSDIGTGKTSAKPYGSALRKMEELEKELKQLKEDYHQYTREKERLFALRNELESLQKKKEEAEHRCSEIKKKAEQQEKRIAMQQEWKNLSLQRDSLQEKMDAYQASLRLQAALQAEIDSLQPPHRITHQEYYQLEQQLKRRDELNRQLSGISGELDRLNRELESLERRHRRLLAMDESKPVEMLYRLQEFQNLERRNLQLENEMSGNGPSQKDGLHQRQPEGREWGQESSGHDSKLPRPNRLHPPAGTGKGWLFAAASGAMITILLLMLFPIAAFLPGFFTLFAIYRWTRNRHRAEESIRRSLLQVEAIQQWHRRELDQNEEMMEKIRQEVKEWLASVTEGLPPFDPPVWEKMIREVARQAKRVREQRSGLILQKETKQREELAVRQDLDQLHAVLAAWEKRYGTADLTQIKIWLDQSEQVRERERIIRAEQEKIEAFEQMRQLENWEEKRKELEDGMTGLSNRLALEEPDEQETDIDWKERFREAEFERERIGEIWSAKKAEFDKLQGSIEKLEEWISGLPDAMTAWECAKQKVQELERERKALELAREVLLEAAREVKENIAPRLAPYVSKWVGTVTGGRYREVWIDPANGLQMKVFVPETGENKEVEALSRGTMDQMVFALRLSLLQFYSSHTKTCLPLILDDCFAHFDEKRLRAALRLLRDFSDQHQIILCTCQHRESKLLREEGMDYHSIQLPG
ncbi:AAA family ATPase [Lihuaxuella thermophila]|uniref:Uncharacterized protein YhaN n=1 Tax=Lihuaxuella thermophila TaxID=1173111 RepID=A0A1H8ASB5_9BACL|nr:AAA family ATPase [Lihuaxuella thermophila]SEM72699.1 Uncharacterized protein YhaN [Lihuaxuella thermophila]